MLRLSALALGSALLACARPAPDTRPPEHAKQLTTPDPTPSLHLRLAPRTEPVPELAVELVARGLPGRTWTLTSLDGLELRDLAARDERGDLALERAADGPGVRITLARAPVGDLLLGYTLRPDVTVAAGDLPAPLHLRLDRDHALVSGEQLLLPATADPLTIHLARADGRPGLATSLGVDDPPTRVRPSELRAAAYLLGPLGRAVFRGPEGADDFAWTGDTRFDLRWSAAETAGARTAVDAWFGAEPGETARFTGLFAVDFDVDDGAHVVPRSGGLYVALGPGADWNASVRLAVAQGLVHRWIGGRLRLRDADEPLEAGLWFSQGVARSIAREVLYDLGTLSAADYADELNRHHAELATSPLRHASNRDVAAAVPDDPDAAPLLVARGVLYATRLDALSKSRHAGARSLQTIVRALIARARERGVAELPLTAFTDLLAEHDPREPQIFRDTIERGAAPQLASDALGPCFVRASRTYTRFDLGFDLAASTVDGRIVGLRPDGPAARAGIREGEPLVSVSVLADDPQTPVDVTLQREGHVSSVSYRPRGASGRGDAWKRDPRASERECPR
jgi:hypothetical protein